MIKVRTKVFIAMKDEMTITGEIYEIIYQNDSNGYTVLEIDSKTDGLFTATGYMPYVSEGEHISVTGYMTMHHEYGEQFKVESYETLLPTDADSILEYLSSGVVFGIRKATAKKIVDNFGSDSLNILLTDPMRLSEIKGISKDRAAKIGESYLKIQSMQSIVMFLQQFNLSTNTAVKIHKILGSDAVKTIKENPYILSELVDGISFKTSDKIAKLQGFPKNSPFRIRSGLKSILTNAAYNSGHTYLPVSALINDASLSLEVSADEVSEVINSAVLSGYMFREIINNEDVCYLSVFYFSEQYVSSRLASFSIYKPECKLSDKEIDKIIATVEKESDIELDEYQRLAVTGAAHSGIIVITGGPGTGKTTTINTIIRVLDSMRLSIALTAPTGRAAKRMSQITGLEAKTIHRLLCVQPSDDENAVRFNHNETNPLPYDVIIVDEVSMIDIQLMQSLLQAVKKGARIIFSGDSDQLPSVGPGNVLRDICESGIVPVIRLKHIFRQAMESLIITNAHNINEGIMPEINRHDNDFFFMQRSSSEAVATTICDLYKYRLPKSYNVNPINSIQILSPSKKGLAGSVNLNKLIQEFINPPDQSKQEHSYGSVIFRTGDKVMQIKNNYDISWQKRSGECGMGIFNGDMGIIESISQKDRKMIIVFDDDKVTEYNFTDLDYLDLAYAITVHKSQGSEFPIVIIPMCRFAPMLMCRNLLYTAVTRAKSMVIIVGSTGACETMVNNNEEHKRYSGLAERLKNFND